MIKRFLQRKKHKLSKRINDVWWNKSLHMNDERFPMVRWEKLGYVDCNTGVVVPMKDLGNGLYAYYKVTKVHRSSGGDWLYDSDRYNCDMVFEMVRKELGVGGVEKQKYPKFITF